MKRLLLFISLCAALTVSAEQALYFASGGSTVATVLLADRPSIKATSADNVTTVSVESANFSGSWAAADMKITLGEYTGIENPAAETGIVVKYLAGNILEVTSPVEAMITLFNTNGAAFGTWHLTAGIAQQIDLNRYAAGVYVLQSGKFAIKVIRK